MEAQGATTDVMDAETGEGAAESGVDFSPVLDRLGEISQRQEQFEQDFGAFRTSLEPQAEEDPDPEFPAFDEDGQVDDRAAQEYLDSLVNKRLEAALEQRLAPVAHDLQEMRAESDAQYLMEKYPQMADAQVQQSVISQARETAAALGIPEGAGLSRQLIELVWKASQADQQAAGEVPVGGLPQHALENPAGAAPGGVTQESIADGIVAARRGNSFWGA